MPNMTIRKTLTKAAFAFSFLVLFPAFTAAGETRPVECWRGWGYLVDGQSNAYKSEELLLVTDGGADWAPGVAVRLYALNRASGRIDDTQPVLQVTPIVARTYYRGTTNYVHALADVTGSNDRIVLGLSHVSPPQAELPRMARFNAWACGLGNGEE